MWMEGGRACYQVQEVVQPCTLVRYAGWMEEALGSLCCEVIGVKQYQSTFLLLCLLFYSYNSIILVLVLMRVNKCFACICS